MTFFFYKRAPKIELKPDDKNRFQNSLNCCQGRWGKKGQRSIVVEEERKKMKGI